MEDEQEREEKESRKLDAQKKSPLREVWLQDYLLSIGAHPISDELDGEEREELPSFFQSVRQR